MLRFSLVVLVLTLIQSLSVLADYVPGERIVRIQESLNASERTDLEAQFKQRPFIQEVRRIFSGSFHETRPTYLLRYSSEKEAADDADVLRAQSGIKYVEVNGIFKLNESTYFPYQWSLSNSGQKDVPNKKGSIGTPGVDIGVQEVSGSLNQTLGAFIPRVAVIDTGLYFEHPDFSTLKVYTNTSEMDGAPGMDDDGNGCIDDYHGCNFAAFMQGGDSGLKSGQPYDIDTGHGTHVTGIIAAQTGILGVTPNVEVLPIRAFKNGFSEGATLAMAVSYAIYNKANIINASWAGTESQLILSEAFNYAEQKNVLVVVAAGNNGKNLASSPLYPAVFPNQNILVVGAIDNSGKKAVFSSYSNTFVDIFAPGVNIISTVPPLLTFLKKKYFNPEKTHAFFSGTSMAAPIVTGVAAEVIRKYDGSISALQAKEMILNTGIPSAALQKVSVSGRRVSLANALQGKALPPIPDDSQWSKFSGPLLYVNKGVYKFYSGTTWNFQVPQKAKWIRAVFTKFNTVKNKDYVDVISNQGEIVDRVSGKKSVYVTEPIYYENGDKGLKIHFQMTGKKAGKGFILERLEYVPL